MSKQRNNNKPHRPTESNQTRTHARIEQYHGKLDLEATWAKMPMAVQCKNHDYVLGLRARIRNIKNYIAHRASPEADF